MRTNWLGIGLLVLLFSSLSILVVLTKRPICIDTTIVDKIDRVTATGTTTAWQCAANRWIPYDEKFTSQLPNLSKALRKLELFFVATKPLQQPIELVWIESPDPTLRLQGHTLYLSEELVLQQRPILESVLRLWLREQRTYTNLDRTLLEGAIVEFIMDSLGFETPTSPRWPTNLYTAQQACEQKIAGPRFMYVCDRGGAGGPALLLGSARSLVSQSLFRAFQSLDLQNSQVVLKALPQFWSIQSDHLNLLAESTTVKSATEIHDELNRVVSLLLDYRGNGSAEQASWSVWMTEFRRQLALQGYREAQSSTAFEQLVILGSDVWPSHSDLLQDMGSLQQVRPSAVLINQDLWMFPTGSRIDATLFPVISADSVTYLSCHAPTESEVAHLQLVSPRLLLVRYCGGVNGGVNEPSLARLLKDGSRAFIAANSKLSYVQLHLPSVPSEMRRHLDTLWPVFADRQWNSPLLQNLGWQEPEWDVSMQAFRSRSIVPAIDSFRL